MSESLEWPDSHPSTLVESLASLDVTRLDDTARIDLIAELERLKAAAAACQARATAAFAASQRAADAARGVRAAQQGAGVAPQVALARRESPVRGRQWVGVSRALVEEMPHTHAALERGDLSEFAATLLVRETAFLTLPHRQVVDAELARESDASWGTRSLADAARALGQRLDPAAAVRRRSDAVRQRRVGVRPAVDGMAYLTGLLPVAEAVRCYATLRVEADRTAATDGRSRSQLMADLLVEHVTGAAPGTAPVEVHLVMTDTALLGDDSSARAHDLHEPAHLVGYGAVPTAVARDLVRDCAVAWVRRLYTHPVDGQLVAMDSRRREFSGLLRRLLLIRDRTCRTPWCDALVRHADHVVPHSEGGPTSYANGQGLCAACNYAKQSSALQQIVDRGGTVVTTTATGHRYRSRVPRLPGVGGRPSRAERRVRTSIPT